MNLAIASVPPIAVWSSSSRAIDPRFAASTARELQRRHAAPFALIGLGALGWLYVGRGPVPVWIPVPEGSRALSLPAVREALAGPLPDDPYPLVLRITTDGLSTRAPTVWRSGRPAVVAGCFDGLHAGHRALIAAAALLGGPVTVLLDNDAAVESRKGRDRPHLPYADRRRALLDSADVAKVYCVTRERFSDLADVWGGFVFVKGAEYRRGFRELPCVLERRGMALAVESHLPHRSSAIRAPWRPQA